MSRRSIVLIVTFIGLSVLSFGARNQDASSGLTQSQIAPLAVIDTILVSGTKIIEASGGSATVTHQSVPTAARAGMLLYAGDDITTGQDTKMTILFLDNRAENQNEVEMDGNSRIQLGSVFTWLGRVIVRVRSRFETTTPTSTYGVRGTEFEVVVMPDGSSTMRVLEGEVTTQSKKISRAIEIPAVQFVAATFSDVQQRIGSQQQMDFVVVAGKEQTVDRDFIFSNSCTQKHTFQIRGPRNLEWFQLPGGDQFEINGNSARTIHFAVRLDTRNVAADTYDGEVIARCIDCSEEAGCNLAGLLLNVRIKVTGPGMRPSPALSPTPLTLSSPEYSPTPAEIPSPVVTSATATKMEQITVSPQGQVTKTPVTDDQISRTLQWSDGIIIASQPGYQAEGVVPHFSSAEERAAVFREARKKAVLGDAASYETLARIYVDWGAGAKAIESLKYAGLTKGDADYLVTLAEGYREMGRLDDAQKTLAAAIDRYPDFAPARVAIGNVFLDRARIAKETRNYEEAKRFFEQARESYARIASVQTSSSTSPTLKQTRPPKDAHARIDRSGQRKPPPEALDALQTVAQSNLGQVFFELGDIAKDQKQLSDATANFQSAEQAFKRAANPASQYPFATKGLGDVYREMGNVSVMKGDVATAGQMRQSAQQKYREALGAHIDFAEAYVALGNLFEDSGQKDGALKAYLQATQVRPEQPAGFYYFAVAVADRNPSLAQAYAQAYLKSEKPVFRQGEKKENADRINQGVPPIQRPTPNAPPSKPSPAVPEPTVNVPGVKGDKPEDALKKLNKIGLKGRIEEQADCKASGKVLSTDPPKDSPANVGQVVILYVSGPGPDAVTVPDLIGRSQSEAEDALRGLNLSARIAGTSPTKSYNPGTVVGQKPDARSKKSKPKLKPGCEVELTLAVAIPQVRVPNYIGMSTQDAVNALPKYVGELIRGDVIVVDDPNAAPGTVADQDPKPDTYVDKGSRVTLYVKAGGGDAGGGGGYKVIKPTEEMVDVPELFGKTFKEAVDLLQPNLGYQIMAGDPNNPSSIVSKQNPTAGQKKVRKGQKIQLWLTVITDNAR